MTTSAPSSRGARRRNGGRRPGAERPVRVVEPAFATHVPNISAPIAAPAPIAPEDYITDFVALGVPAPLIAVLAARDVTSAFPIQSATLPDSLPVATCSAAARPAAARPSPSRCRSSRASRQAARHRQSGKPRALILVPTRELANQVVDIVEPARRRPCRCASPPSTAASARARRSPHCARVSTSSSPARAGSKT